MSDLLGLADKGDLGDDLTGLLVRLADNAVASLLEFTCLIAKICCCTHHFVCGGDDWYVVCPLFGHETAFDVYTCNC